MCTEREFELTEVEERIAPSFLGGLLDGGAGANVNAGASTNGSVDAGIVQASWGVNANVSAGTMLHF